MYSPISTNFFSGSLPSKRPKIKGSGGLKAIVISHPHFYSTYVEWARAFDCPVYMSEEDKEWLHRQDVPRVKRMFINGSAETIVSGVTAVKAGGHFDGSLVLHWEKRLFVADTLMATPVCVLLQFQNNSHSPSSHYPPLHILAIRTLV